MPRPPHHPALHRLAVLTTVATFPLIFLGGLVTSHGAGLSVPDWPNSYGYNMFTFPPSQWVGGILYEHTHRLLGTIVGLGATLMAMVAWGLGREREARKLLWVTGGLCLFLAGAGAATPTNIARLLAMLPAYAAFVLIGSTFCRRPEPRRWVRWLAMAVLGAVIVQGVLGGLRVVLIDLNLAVVHGCLAQAVFCLTALVVVATSSWWERTTVEPPQVDQADARRLVALATAGVVVVYAQLVVGALMRHYRAGLAVPDLPLAYGKVLPPADATALAAANQVRAWDYHLEPVSLGQVWLHFGHRIGAIAVTVVLAGLIVHAIRRHRGHAGNAWGLCGALVAVIGALVGLGAAHAVGSTRGIVPGAACFAVAAGCGYVAWTLLNRLRTATDMVRPAVMLAALLVVQVALGVLTVAYRKPADVASAHVAVGALVLVTTFVMAARAVRVYRLTSTAAVASAVRERAGFPGRDVPTVARVA